MKRLAFEELLSIGTNLFKKIYKRKRLCGHNHDIHLLSREIDHWLPKGIKALQDGTYTPCFLTRYHLPDEVVDCLYLADRVLQHLILKSIKPTFKHVINENCYHMVGPSGVKHATQKIRKALSDKKPNYFIRADIKSYYSSIAHHKLIEDLKFYYNDRQLLTMLENIINNSIDTQNGIINPITGIALRGPLSQFFSAIYLKSLDDTFNNMELTYIRYQDDILILCKSERQMQRAKQRMNKVLHERYMKLSRRKTCMGRIHQGFHFLGIDYPGTQTQGKTNEAAVTDSSLSQQALNIAPHPRTLRKARENVKAMVTDGVSRPKIRCYLFRWLCWWQRTSGLWKRDELLEWFIKSCWDKTLKLIAKEVYHHYLNKLHTISGPTVRLK